MRERHRTSPCVLSFRRARSAAFNCSSSSRASSRFSAGAPGGSMAIDAGSRRVRGSAGRPSPHRSRTGVRQGGDQGRTRKVGGRSWGLASHLPLSSPETGVSKGGSILPREVRSFFPTWSRHKPGLTAKGTGRRVLDDTPTRSGRWSRNWREHRATFALRESLPRHESRRCAWCTRAPPERGDREAPRHQRRRLTEPRSSVCGRHSIVKLSPR